MNSNTAWVLAWFAVSIAVSVAIVVTGKITPLWFFLIPAFISVSQSEKKNQS